MKWVGAFAVVLSAVFFLSSIEKARLLATGTSRWHPLLVATPWRRTHAVHLLTLALLCDLVAALLLLASPSRGGWLALVLIIAYTMVALSTPAFRHSHSDCHCLGGFLDTRGPHALLLRNLGLIGIAVFVSLTSGAELPLTIDALLPGLALLSGISLIWLISRRVLATVSLLPQAGRVKKGRSQ
jgi:hypothetical protein